MMGGRCHALLALRGLVIVGLLWILAASGVAAEPAPSNESVEGTTPPDGSLAPLKPEAAAQACAGAWTLTSLQLQERELVFSLCMLRETSGNEGLSSADDDARTRLDVTFQRARRVEWQLRLLTRLVPKGLHPDDLPDTTLPKAEAGCLDLQVAKDERSTLWLDGTKVEVGRVDEVSMDVPHMLAVMHRKAPGEWVVEAEETVEIPSAAADTSECLVVELDLRSSRGVALTPVVVDDACGDFGPSGSAVWGNAARFLERNAPRAGLSFRDLNGVARAAKWLEDVQSSLTSLGGEPLGAKRGQRATEYQVALAGAELWRQGVQEVISLEVQCRRDPSSVGLRLSVVGRSLNLDVLHASNVDPVAGIELGGLIEVDTELVHDSDAVEPAVRHLISRLLELRYLQFTEFRREVPFAQQIAMVVEFVDPAGGPEYEFAATPRFDAFAPDRSMAAAICPSLENTGRVAGRPPEDVTLGRPLASPRWKERSHSARTRTYLLQLDPPRPGPIIVRAQLATNGAEMVEYRCLDVVQAPRMITAELAIGALEHDKRISGRTSLRTSLTVDFLAPLRGSIGRVSLERFHLGMGGGVSIVNRRYEALPAWDGLPMVEPTDQPASMPLLDRDVSLEWNRYSVVLGPRGAIVVRPLCRPRWRHGGGWCSQPRRGFVVVVAGAIDLDLGFFQARVHPDSYSVSQGDLPIADFDVDMTAKLLLGYQLSPRQAVSIGLIAWIPGIDDRTVAFFQGQFPQQRSTPSYDFFPMLGGLLRYGWSL